MPSPLVSVIIPSYNHGRFIRQAIDSVLNQTYANFELLISDDGSSDNSVRIIKSYTDKRIRTHFFPENEGQKANLDYWTGKTNGKYAALLPSDDVWEFDKLEKQVDFLENNPEYGAVFSYVNIINDNGELIPDAALAEVFNVNRTHSELLRCFFFKSNCLAAMSCLIRADLLMPLLRKCNYLRQLGDFEYWLALAKMTKIHIMPEYLAYHRMMENKTNMSAPVYENNLRFVNEITIIFRSFFDGMPDGLFTDVFSDALIKKSGHSKEELLCEQALIYLNIPYSYGRMLAAEKLHQLSTDPKTLSVLRNTYGIKQNDFSLLLTSYIGIQSDIKQKYEAKFAGILDILRSGEYRAAVYGSDSAFTERLLLYLDQNGKYWNRIVCFILSSDSRETTESIMGIPVLPPDTAITEHGVNCIIISSYIHQETFYQDIKSYEQSGVIIKKLFSIVETKADIYE